MKFCECGCGQEVKYRRRFVRGHHGRCMSNETKQKLREMNTGKPGRKHTDRDIRMMSGENSPNWQGGISFGPYCPEFSGQVREEVREKFGRLCFLCGKPEPENGRKLDVHHVDYNKMQGCDDHEWKLVPLCRSCHAKTCNGDREAWENIIIEKLEA